MRKIPTLFQRTEDRRYVTDQVNPGCEWVLAGEGRPTRKYDGTCCLISGGVIYKRRELKDVTKAPADFEAADFDPVTGKTVGWVPCSDTKEDRWHKEAFLALLSATCGVIPDGTYELVGPKINGNPEHFEKHALVRHGDNDITSMFHWPLTVESIRWAFEPGGRFDLAGYEGVVWHHPDGRMAKLKRRDFPR